MTPARAILPLAAALSAGCASQPALTPVQLEAIQTREIDAPVDAAFRAAAGVMLDRGMIITLSDGSAGLIGAREWMDAPHAHTHATPDSPYAPVEVVVWVRSADPGRSLLRIQFGRGGLQDADAETVSRFAEDVGDRTLTAPRKGGTR